MIEETMSIRGSCLCGAVRYELTETPTRAHNCHCSRCRKSRGAAFASNLIVPRDGFHFLGGEEHVQAYKVPDAARFTHAFCRDCGSSLPWFNAAYGVMIVPMGSLDEDPGIAPGSHIFVESKAAWFTISDDLPQHPGPPGSR
jgi:hypothetical protein